MKKPLFAVFPLLAAGLAACTSGPPETARQAGLVGDCPFPYTDAPAPAWVCRPSDEGYEFSAVGVAEMSGAGLSFTRQQAVLDGRRQLAQEVGARVALSFKEHVGTVDAGVGSAEAVNRMAAGITRNIASRDLSGSRMEKYAVAPDGRYYALVVMDDEDGLSALSSAMQEEADSSEGDERVVWRRVQEQAEEGFDALAREMARWRED